MRSLILIALLLGLPLSAHSADDDPAQMIVAFILNVAGEGADPRPGFMWFQNTTMGECEAFKAGFFENPEANAAELFPTALVTDGFVYVSENFIPAVFCVDTMAEIGRMLERFDSAP